MPSPKDLQPLTLSRQKCSAFAQGKCSYGAKCKFLHDQSPRADTQRPKRRICKYFLTTRGCDQGKSCHFLHDRMNRQEASDDLPKLAKEDRGTVKSQSDWLTWVRMIPESIPATRSLGHRLGHFFPLACRLVLDQEVGTRQQVITKLASEGGL